MSALIGAIDQGTSSSRFLVFDLRDESVIAEHQIAIHSVYPQEGWVEQDPMELLNTVKQCLKEVYGQLNQTGRALDLKAVGVTNQRESTVVWDKTTGLPIHNAIIWLDTRTQSTVNTLLKCAGSKGKDSLRDKCGLPISTYFSAVKLRWLLDNIPEVSEAAKAKRLLFGTVDSWLIWNLTGGVDGGRHVTDVTNASRTMLMNLKTLQWDQELLDFFGIQSDVLPKICSSAEIYGHLNFSGNVWSDMPIAGCLGDQQAALVGHQSFTAGTAKSTLGTGCFMLFNVGEKIVASSHGLLSTVGYQLGPEEAPVYALEGSIAIAGAAVKWLQDQLGIIKEPREIELVASKVEDTSGVYFVPAFSGLFAPHWRSDAKGVITGLTQFSNAAHICRAVLEAIAFQTRDIVDCMYQDSGLTLNKLLVDGAMTKNNLLMQIHSDILDIEVVRPEMPEFTALGAAFAAGKAVGLWEPGRASGNTQKIFRPIKSPQWRDEKLTNWHKSLEKSLNEEPLRLRNTHV